jgi:hypothetical protein
MSKQNKCDLSAIVERKREETANQMPETPDPILGGDMLDKSLDLANRLRVGDAMEDD